MKPEPFSLLNHFTVPCSNLYVLALLVPELVVVLAGLLPRFDGDHPDRGRLVQRVGGDLSPGLLDDHRLVTPSWGAGRGRWPSPWRPWPSPIPCCRAFRRPGRAP